VIDPETGPLAPLFFRDIPMLSANEVRRQFIDFFKDKHGHTFVPSSSVVPLDDPTLLFTNAGMNQFKDVFLATGTRPYKRAVNSQKCIRAGGKHNDLDDVGKDTYHHTFFEMLGNWSFGDYFKKEAISWAWELLTKVWGMDRSRLHATVFEGDPANGLERDDEAFSYWKTLTDIDPAHIHYGNKKDNFWEMGETGPCGPCSEIHYDRTPDKSGSKLVNAGSPDVIEIWNLVFMQFNRGEDKKLTPLPAQHVDTGMGFERVTAVLQGKNSNYDTDVFAPLMEAIGKIVGRKYGAKLDDLNDIAFRVIADHVRMATFAITDGAKPGNKGRDSVVKSVIRRGVRYGWQCFEQRKPFLYELVPTVVDHFGGAFPELRGQPQRVQNIIKKEEADFLRTTERGIGLFQEVAARTRKSGSSVISGEDAFQLHTTYGFSVDITQQMASEIGMSVDVEAYKERFKRFQEESDKERKKFAITAVTGDLPKTDDAPKYQGLAATAKVLGWVCDSSVVREGRVEEDEEVALVLDRTNFYAEQGGQVGDTGSIATPTGRFIVDDTQKLGDGILHVGRVTEGHIEAGQTATLEVSGSRADTMRNHTATHLLNWALRRVLGDHIQQKGSLVDAEKTRFDFSHDQPLTPEQINEIERLVNEQVYLDLPVSATIMPLDDAKKIPGVRAVFGEKYPDPVRVLVVGAADPHQATFDNSVEFCGGTHLKHTGEAGFFKIVGQEGLGKGVRRLTAVTGREAVASVQRLAATIDSLAGRFNCKPEEVPARVDALQEEIKKLQQQMKKGAAADLQTVCDHLFAAALQVNGARVIIGQLPGGTVDQVRQQVDRLRQKAGSAVVVLGWADDGKVQVIAAVTEDLVQKGGHAGKLVGKVAEIVGGKGGGKPTMAQGGGTDPSKLSTALDQAKQWASDQVKG
jgi:alanyl-tRNA synthetase